MPVDVQNTQQQTIQSQLPIDLGQFATTLSNLYANDPSTGGIVQLFMAQTKNYINGYEWAMQQAQQQTGNMPTGQAQEFMAQQGQRYYGQALQQLNAIATTALNNKNYLEQLKVQYAQWQQQFAENQRQFNAGLALQQQNLDLARGKANMEAFAQGMQGVPTLSQLAAQGKANRDAFAQEEPQGQGGTANQVYDPQGPSGRFQSNAIDNLSELPAGSSIALDSNGRQMIDPLTRTVTYDIPGEGQAMYKATPDATTPGGTPVFIPIQYQASNIGASSKYQPPVLGGTPDLTTQQNPYQQPSNFYTQQQQQNQGQPYNMYSSLGSYTSQSPISQSISNITGTGLQGKPAPTPNTFSPVSTGNTPSITGFYTGGGGVSPQSSYTGSGAYTGGSWASPATTSQGFYSSYVPGSQGYYGL